MTVPHPQHANKDAQAARKRRRRAPAGGAADDCFACVKRGTKCDRKRPYCSQCQEVGNECSGYKTQLTWGVGVASRGKLRGLSLPVAKSAPVAPVNKKAASRARANSTATSRWSDQDASSPKSNRSDGDVKVEPISASVPTTPFASFNDFPRYSQAEAATPMSAVTTHAPWASIPSYAGGLASQPSKFHKINTSMAQFPLMSEPMSSLSSSVDSLHEVDYTISPMAHSYQRDEYPFSQSPSMMYDGYASHSSPVTQSPASAILIDQHAPTSCPGLVYAPSEASSSLGSHHDHFEPAMSHRFMADSDNLSVPELDSYSTSPHSTASSFWGPSASKADDAHRMPSPTSVHPALRYESHSLQVSPDLIAKIPFFMDYYEKVMCPSMVLIDGPDNPFRGHILRLASSSRSLQHAICAVSACNLRMKRRLSLGQHSRESPLADTGKPGRTADSPNDPALSEEYQHRNLAVNLLNQQLNDPASASHDSVLATILLLCHYRMIESGIAKFHTQFAGVKKILNMRGSTSSSSLQGSRDSSWMQSIFTYFDSISASINDREAQLDPSSCGGLPSDSPILPPGVENWIGCDRELFKTISKLGRLNLLSQHRPVKSMPTTPGVQAGNPLPTSPLGSPLGQSFKQPAPTVNDFFGISAPRFDGNGFTSQLDDEQLLASGLCSPATYDDHRANFWREWKEARLALQDWQFDAQRLIATLPGSPSANQIRDLGALSEAFRYAALLYMERLAAPNVPSTHNSFRNLVSQVIYYATSLESGSSAEKFLLWSLFVAGSECVNELQQNIVRTKCRDIMARSGYMNNHSAVEILECIWSSEAQLTSDSQAKTILRRGPFSWTRWIGGPGVDVEWIMF